MTGYKNAAALLAASTLVRPAAIIGAVRADLSNPESILNELRRTHEEFMGAVNTRLDAKVDDVLLREKEDRINAAMNDLQAEMDNLNRRLAASAVGTVTDNRSPEQRAHAEAFDRFFRRGLDANLQDLAVQAGLTTQSDPDGGYVVPAEMEATIDRVLGVDSAMRSLARVQRVSAQEYRKLVNTGGADSGWVGEKDARPETQTPKLTALTFSPAELYANPAATQTALDDASMDLAAWLAEEVSIAFAEDEGAAFIGGDGVEKPRGLLSYPTVANASWAWGKIGFVKSGDASAFISPTSSASPADCLVDLVYNLKRGFRQGGAFLMNDLTQSIVRKFKDGEGNFLWQPALTAGQPASLLGYPVETDDNMPDVGAGTFPIAFGDFRRGYMIVDRIGIRVLRDPFTNKPHVHFYTTKRVGGGIQNFQAIKLLKISS